MIKLPDEHLQDEPTDRSLTLICHGMFTSSCTLSSILCWLFLLEVLACDASKNACLGCLSLISWLQPCAAVCFSLNYSSLSCHPLDASVAAAVARYLDGNHSVLSSLLHHC